MANAHIELIRELFAAGIMMPSGTIAEQRKAMELSSGALPVPDGVTVTPTNLGGRPAEWLGPAIDSGIDAGDSLVLYLHGGGYCIGSISTHRNLAGRLALACGGRVVNLEYRLAPEHPFPAAIDDVVAAYAELIELGHDPACIAIAGDSAGGGLTVAALLAIRDSTMVMPAAGVCLSPWTDLTQSASTWTTRADADPVVTKAGLDMMAAAYLDGGSATDPLASPAFADLTGLPPLLVQVGEAEVLLDDSVGLRNAALAAGVDVTLDVWADMIHVFQAFPPGMLPESDAGLARIAAFLDRHLG